MAPKKLESGSKYEHLDANGDGIISDEEMAAEERLIELERKREAAENDGKLW